MNQNKTQPTSQDVLDFLSGVPDEQKRLDSLALIEMMQEVSGKPATMWGPSIIGFDTYHYVYESGREGDMCVIGFSPRKSSLVLYLLEALGENEPERVKKLGKCTTSKGCLYIKRLNDVDLDVLKELIEVSYRRTKQRWP
ncbi:TPA: DUF1801 domain-containing protein [Candidatus Saccharibacteria bacterium]|nr:DUF1801 domain-containing protein [Candidatus Saccharibacteria bacterium]HRK40668.1 DUF1801 domain-containing protein [Candidatus Saccharibacteria bacterium]